MELIGNISESCVFCLPLKRGRQKVNVLIYSVFAPTIKYKKTALKKSGQNVVRAFLNTI